MLFGEDDRSNSVLNKSRRASSIDNVIRPSFKKRLEASRESQDSSEKSNEINEESPVRDDEDSFKHVDMAAILKARDQSYKNDLEKVPANGRRKTVMFEDDAVVVEADENYVPQRAKGFSIRRMKT